MLSASQHYILFKVNEKSENNNKNKHIKKTKHTVYCILIQLIDSQAVMHTHAHTYTFFTQTPGLLFDTVVQKGKLGICLVPINYNAFQTLPPLPESQSITVELLADKLIIQHVSCSR